MSVLIGSTAYDPGSLREDFARFRFLLDVTDSEGLFISGEPWPPGSPGSTVRNASAAALRVTRLAAAATAVRLAAWARKGPASAWWRTAGDRSRLMRDSLEQLAGRLISPLIGHTCSLADAAKAHEAIEARRTVPKTLLLLD